MFLKSFGENLEQLWKNYGETILKELFWRRHFEFVSNFIQIWVQRKFFAFNPTFNLVYNHLSLQNLVQWELSIFPLILPEIEEKSIKRPSTFSSILHFIHFHLFFRHEIRGRRPFEFGYYLRSYSDESATTWLYYDTNWWVRKYFGFFLKKNIF